MTFQRLQLVIGGAVSTIILAPAFFIAIILAAAVLPLLYPFGSGLLRLISIPIALAACLCALPTVWYFFGRTFSHPNLKTTEAMLWFSAVPVLGTIFCLCVHFTDRLKIELIRELVTLLDVLSIALTDPFRWIPGRPRLCLALGLLLLVLSAAFCLGYRHRSIKPLLLGLLLLSCSGYLFAYTLTDVPPLLADMIHASVWGVFGWWLGREIRE